MTRKNFKMAFNSLLKEDVMNRASYSKDDNAQEVRATFIVKKDSIEKLKAIAFWERETIKKILGDALDAYLINYEQTNGSVILPNKK